jgi:hypothetical protein
LSLLVSVPVSSRTRSESNIGDSSFVIHVNHVKVDIASKCGGGLGGCLASVEPAKMIDSGIFGRWVFRQKFPLFRF